MKKVLLLTIVALLPFVFVACTEATTETAEVTTAAPAKDDLTITGYMTAETLDPFQVASSDKVTNFQIFDSLVRYGDSGVITPGLASDWTLEDDGLTYTFTIREGVLFHNGATMTTEDIIFSMDTMMAQPMNSWMGTYIASYTRISSTSIQVVKASPFAKVLNILADRFFVVPEATYDGAEAAFADAPIGTGAYKFVSQGADKSVTLIKNEDYFFGVPAITNVTIIAPVEAAAAVIQLESGDVDIIFGIPTSQKQIITDNNDLTFVETAGWSMHTLLLLGEDFADDINLRKAVSYAVNPQNAILVANEGVGEVPTNLFSTKTMGDLAGEVAIPGYDATEAAAALALSDYTTATELVITVDASAAAIAQSIQSDLATIGITVTIEQLDNNALFTKLMANELDMTILPMGTHMNGVEEMLAFPIMPPFSFGMSPSEARTSVITNIQTETDPALRANMCIEALQYAVAEFDIVPVFEPVQNLAYANTIAGIPAISAATNIFYLGEVVPA